jgi:hypothetical protein
MATPGTLLPTAGFRINGQLIVDRCHYPLVVLDPLVDFGALFAHRGSIFVPLWGDERPADLFI